MSKILKTSSRKPLYKIQNTNTIEYGALYNWYAASKNGGSGTGSIAPDGWHVPTYAEWNILLNEVGTDNGYHLSESGTTYWNEPNLSDNYSGFNSRGNGLRPYFQGLREKSTYYSVDKYGFIFWPVEYSDFIYAGYDGYEYYGLGIRLIKNTSDWVDGETITDYDGNVYPTVKIGNQVWMAANLVVTHYNDGTPIPNVTDNATWAALTAGAMCYYNNDINNAYTTTFSNKILKINNQTTQIKYGALYNWHAISKNGGTGAGSVAPIGWHVPSKEEFTTLISEIGGYTNGYKLKEIGINNWDEPNIGATNELLFNAKGAGYRYYNGEFYNLKKTLRLISITLIGGFDQILELSNTSPDVTQIQNGYNNLGFSVRLIKDDSNDPLILKDIDGNVYPTVKIGDQVWIAANLAVTHYNDGTEIPIVTDNTAWAALSTGAMCYYDNDVNNAVNFN